MRVSLKFTVIILILSLAMSSLTLGVTAPVSAETAQRYLLIAGAGFPANLDALVASVGGILVAEYGEISVAVAESGEPSFAIAAESLPGIQAVVRDARTAVGASVEADTVLSDAVFDEAVGEAPLMVPNPHPAQWNLRAIKAKDAWLMGYMGMGAVVAVVDSGIDAGHPGLSGQVLMPPVSKSFVNEFVSPNDALFDRSEHGTHIASVIAAKSGVPGVAPQAKLVSVKVLKWNPVTKRAEGNESDIIAGILYAVNLGIVDVINVSAGFTFEVNGRESAHQLAALNRTINYAHQQGVLVVASVGNGASNLNRNRNQVKAPAEITHVVAVSGTGPITIGNTEVMDADTFASFSDYGSAVYVAAPGGNILVQNNVLLNNPLKDWIPGICSRQSAAHPECGRAPLMLSMAGTSQAAAHVSGLAALIVGKFGGEIAPELLRAILKLSADDLGKKGNDEQYGFGRINAVRAVTTSP